MHFARIKRTLVLGATCIALSAAGSAVAADPAPESERTVSLALTADDVIPTGNDWIALPAIRASDGALQNFNVISMRYRGLLEVAGVADRPLMTPFVEIAGVRRPLAQLKWSLRDYWIPDRDDGGRRRARPADLCRSAGQPRRDRTVSGHQSARRAAARRAGNGSGLGQDQPGHLFAGTAERQPHHVADADRHRHGDFQIQHRRHANSVGLRLCRIAGHTPHRQRQPGAHCTA